MKKTIYFLLLAFVCLSTQAQSINTDSLINYSSAVINRVYEIGSKINLTIVEQKSLADLFKEEEVAIVNLIIANATSEDIESQKAVYKYRFNHLLPTQKIDTYYKSVAGLKAKRVAKLNASFLQKKYNTDNTMKQYLDNMFSWRDGFVEENFLRYSDTTIIDSNVYTIIQAYDTLLEKYIHTAQSQALIKDKIDIIKNINSNIDNTKLSNLTNLYSNLALQHPTWSLLDNFNLAFNLIFNQVNDTPYYAALYKDEIILNAYFASKNALNNYIRQNQISQATAIVLKPIITDREYEIALINKLFVNYNASRDTIIDSIYNKYKDDIDRILVRNGNLQSASQFDIALLYYQQLQLSESQITSLADFAEQYRKMREEFRIKDPTGEYNNNEFESQHISETLTAEQYTDLLTIKYKSLSEEMSKKDWAYLVDLSLNQNFIDPEITKNELTNYHLALFIAYYRNANDKEKQIVSINNIKEIMPEAMRQLIDKWTFKSPYEYNPDIFFQW